MNPFTWDNSRFKKDFHELLAEVPFVFCEADFEKEDLVFIEALGVHQDSPPGTGTNFLRELQNLCQEYNYGLALELGKEGYRFGGKDFKKTESEERLRRFYERIGFVYSPETDLMVWRYSVRLEGKTIVFEKISEDFVKFH